MNLNIFQSKEKKFWNWFENHSEELLKNDEQDSEIINALSSELKKVNNGLTFEMSVKRNDIKKEFTISADGNPALISCVEKVYDSRPTLQEWEIKKFRQRMQGFDIDIGDICKV